MPSPASELDAADRRSPAAAACELVDADALVALASRLIEQPSLSGDESSAQRLVAEMLHDAGMTVETWEADVNALSAHPAYSAEFDRDEVLGVVGRLGDPTGRSLLLTTHVDVVPVGDPTAWSTPAFSPSVRTGRLFGRGACDAKGGLAAAIHAVDVIRRAGIRLAGEVIIASVVGEEDGGCGTLATLLHGLTADGCIVLEPTDLNVMCAAAGALSFRIHVTGRTAHGAIRHEGVSAIEKLAPVLLALQQLETERNEAWRDDPAFGWLPTPFAICAGRVRGGDWPSNEAAWLELEGRYGVSPSEDLPAAKAALETAIAAAAATDPWLRDHPPRVEWWGAQFLPGRSLPDSFPVNTLTDAVRRTTGSAKAPRGMPYGCDMGLITQVGSIATAVYGPGDVRVTHGPDEHVPIDQLVQCARTLVKVIVDSCGGPTS